jgi:hypothetical protein
MKRRLLAMAIVSGTLVVGGAIGQEHKHEEHKEEVKAPGVKAGDAVKAESKKCCEAMEKAGEAKEGTPTKADAKTKQEKMKEMKEKMKGMDGMKMKDMKSDGKLRDAGNDTHQH